MNAGFSGFSLFIVAHFTGLLVDFSHFKLILSAATVLAMRHFQIIFKPYCAIKTDSLIFKHQDKSLMDLMGNQWTIGNCTLKRISQQDVYFSSPLKGNKASAPIVI